MRSFCWLIACLTIGALRSFALDAPAYFIDARVTVSASPPVITLSWPQTSFAREYVIRRKHLHEQSWSSTLAVLPGNATQFSDAGVLPGTRYEYAIEMATSHFPYPDGTPADWTYGYTYICAGINAALEDFKGKVLLLVDSSLAGQVQNDLAGFQLDLVGAGWNVIRRDVSRSASVVDVRNLVRSEYNADPANLRSVILIGHVPVPYSGNIAPDLHPSHRGAWPADGFYGEMNGNWTDHIVSVTSEDRADNDNFPGDGKFDQSTFPSPVELEIGRIDFWNMTSFLPSSEAGLLKRYLQKNHQFRHRAFTSARRGLVRDNFGDLDGDTPAVDAWRHFGLFFGPGNIQLAGPNEFFPTLNSQSFLWSYGAGGGGFKKADTIGSTPDFASNSPQSVFMILHGSYFGDWNNEDNFLRAAIAGPGYTLASVWSGLPHWFMHPMALGKTIGYSTRISQNNINLYKSNKNFSAGEVHVSLIGDPTLEMFPVIPPSNLSAHSGGSINLSWSPSSDSSLVGYHVYYSGSLLGPYQRLTSTPVSSTTYSHSIGAGTHHYMVRAIKLEASGSGTYYNASQGIFASTTNNGGSDLPIISISSVDSEFSEDNQNTASIRLTRNPVTGSPLTVHLAFSGPAANGADYTGGASSISIPAWSATADLTLTAVQDGAPEGDEACTISIQSNSAYLIGAGSVTLTLRDSVDVPQIPTISPIADQTIPAGSSTGNIPFRINDPDTPAGSLTVRAGSSDHSLVRLEDIQFGGEGENRWINITAPNSGTGQVKITVTVSDGVLEATRNLFVNIENPDQPPTANPLALAIDEDSSIAFVLQGSDPEGAALEYIISIPPANGEIAGHPPNLTYTPRTNYSGTDALSFYVSDGELDSPAATVSITIAGVNDLPIAREDELTAVEGQPATIEILALIENDTDIEGGVLFDTAAPLSLHGAAVSVGSSFLTYTPPNGFVGSDSFSYSIQDSLGAPATGTVFVEVLRAPRFTTITRHPTGEVALRFNGPPNSTIKIQACALEFAWIDIGEAQTDGEGLGEFTDPSPSHPSRYYKLVWEKGP